MKVKDVMTPFVEGVSPDTPLRDAAERMKALSLDPLPVIENGKLAGMLTARSVEQAAARAGLAAGNLPSRQAMMPSRTCREDDDLDQGSRAMTEEDSGLVVVNDQGQVTGVVDRHALEPRSPVRPGAEAGAAVASGHVPFAPYAEDPVDHMSQESFPASDPPPPEARNSPPSSSDT